MSYVVKLQRCKGADCKALAKLVLRHKDAAGNYEDVAERVATQFGLNAAEKQRLLHVLQEYTTGRYVTLTLR